MGFRDIILTRHKIRVEIVYIREGMSGEFDSSDPADTPLLRFNILRRIKKDWESIDGASYCTQVSMHISRVKARALAEVIMDEVYDPASRGESIKKLCEKMSWMCNLTWKIDTGRDSE